MSILTRAALVRQPGGPFSFEDVELDDPRPDEVLVRIAACGVCHTDIAVRDGLFGMPLPAVLGHEGSGVIERVGGEVAKLRAGDKVVLSFSSCGKCSGCRAGRPSRCSAFDELNFGGARADGSTTIHDPAGMPVAACFFGQSSFARHVIARERSVVSVNAGSDDELAMFAPLGCGVQAGAGTVLNELKPRPGDSVVIFGAGTVGLSALMAARLCGASPIAAVDIVPSRLELAAELGADLVMNAREEDVGARLANIIPNADHAVETTGVSHVIDHAVRSLGPRGNLSLLGVAADGANQQVSPKSPGPRQRVFYSIAGDSDPQKFIPFLIARHREGKFPFDRLIRQYPATKINEAVRDSINGSAIKPLLRFHQKI